jgi:Ca-activated chloride channel family protein
MKNLLTALLLSGIAAVGIAAQSTQTVRPRVAPTGTPTIKNDTQIPSTDRKPPVLNGPGGVKPSATSQSGSATKAEQDGVYRIDTNLVTMPVSVLDKQGRFISGLNQKDFKIFENGVEQKVEYFQSVEQPFTVILMIDVSPSTQWQIEDIQNAASQFIDQLRPNDKVMVMSFDEKVHILSQITSDRNNLRNAIYRTRFGDGTSLYDAVDHVLEQELNQIQGRKAVVLFTDGVDTTSRNSSFESTAQAAEEADALFYPIRFDTSRDMNGGFGGYGGGGGYPPPSGGGGGGWGGVLGVILRGGGGGYPGPVYGRGGRRGGRGNGSSPEEYATGKKYLETLAQNSGGREFEADSLPNLDAAFSGIAEELRRQYSLGYYPDKIGQMGERKQISIRVDRPGVVVRAKNSYIVGQTNRSLAGK